MAVIVSVSTWEAEKPYSLYRYCQPSIDNGFYYVCRKNGTSGTTEPNFITEKDSITIDNTIEWLCIPKIESDFDINSFLPEINRDNPQQKLYYIFRDMMTFIISDNENRLKNITNKYIDPYSLEDEYINEIIKENGYEYILETKQFTSQELKNFLFFLKVIHALKGTRKGVQLVLDLIGYPYTEELWYEMSPKGEPHTARVELQMNFSNFTPSIFTALDNFFRNYVYPIVYIIADLEPFKFVSSTIAVTGVPVNYFESNETYLVPALGQVESLAYSDLSYDSVQANWSVYESIALSEYLIDISSDNFSTFFSDYWDYHIDKNTNFLVINDLVPETEYKYRVRARLKNNLYTPYSDPITFTTTSVPIPDTSGSSGSSITEVSFTAEWGEI